eukprot:4828599-Alexandrium_andersonii.AAC.1
MWLIDAGCGHDLVAKARAVMPTKWIGKAERPLRSQLRMATRRPIKSSMRSWKSSANRSSRISLTAPLTSS